MASIWIILAAIVATAEQVCCNCTVEVVPSNLEQIIQWYQQSACRRVKCLENCYSSHDGLYCLQVGGCHRVVQLIPCVCPKRSSDIYMRIAAQLADNRSSIIVYRTSLKANGTSRKNHRSNATTASTVPVTTSVSIASSRHQMGSKPRRRTRTSLAPSTFSRLAASTVTSAIATTSTSGHGIMTTTSRAQLDAQRATITYDQLFNTIMTNEYQCGIQSDIRFRIDGGMDVLEHSWPWHVGLTEATQLEEFEDAEIFCGGTLVHPRFVVTAAHCVKDGMQVLLGEHNRQRLSGHESLVAVDRAYKIAGYRSGSAALDIALLRLVEPVQRSASVGFACLPASPGPAPAAPGTGTVCTVVGWGKKRDEDRTGAAVLQQTELRLQHSRNCAKKYKHNYRETLHLCAGAAGAGPVRDTCAGDSGGGLFCRVQQDVPEQESQQFRWILHGVTTGGDRCGVGHLSVYQNVTHFAGWIRERIVENAPPVNASWY